MAQTSRDVDQVVKRLDRALRELFNALVADGWQVVDASTGPMGEVLVDVERDAARVRLFHERGDPTIEVGAVEWIAPYSVSIWHEYLTGEQVDALSPMAAQAAMLRSDLDAIRSALAGQTVDERTLQAIGARQRWSLPGWPN